MARGDNNMLRQYKVMVEDQSGEVGEARIGVAEEHFEDVADEDVFEILRKVVEEGHPHARARLVSFDPDYRILSERELLEEM